MQILAICGENIASLAQPFEIRLDVPPLSAAGLFAITGETGAGKSSLLDAMCLALYGNCPRLSGDGTRETVDDVEGHALKSNDPRMVLRRSAARGFAQVTFRGADSEVYTAGWSARRARDRIDGRLQNVDRSLVRVADGQVLETQLTLVNEKVVELTGLTYDEFRRTVLLAQGEFDAFLGARTDERAAILEKVTGTQIYRDISRRVFERQKQAEAVLATLETRRGEHQLLGEDDRSALTAEIAGLRAVQAEAAQALKEVQGALAAYAAMEAARHRLVRAKARVAAAEEAVAQRAPDRAWLQDWERAAALRSEVREVRSAATDHDEAAGEAAEAGRELDLQRAELDTVQGVFDKARLAHEDAKRSFKEFGPVWDAAAALDSRIATAAQEVTAAEQALAGHEAQFAEADRACRQLLDRQATLGTTIETHQAALAKIPGHAELLASRAFLEERLDARIAAAKRLEEAERQKADLSRGIAKDTGARGEAEQAIRAAGDAIAAARRDQDDMAEERERLRASAPAMRLERLSQAVIDLKALRQAAEAVRDADEAQAASAARLAGARAARDAAKATHGAAGAQAREAAAVLDALRRPSEAAQAAASREAEHLRQQLVDGEPCPVCRATHHPILADDEIARLAAELRAQMDAAWRTREEAEQALRDAAAAITAAETGIEAERTAEPRLAQDVEAAIAGFEVARKPLENGQAGLDVPADPRTPDACFADLLARLAGWRSALETDRDRLAELDRRRAQATARIEAEEGRITTEEARKRQIDARLAQTEAEIARLGQDGATATREIASIDRHLAPLLAPLLQRPESFGAAGGDALAGLRRMAERVAATTAQIAQAQQALSDLAGQIGEAKSALDAAGRARNEAATLARRRREDCDRLTTDRAALLGGEETATHRTRHNAARIAAEKAFEAATEGLSAQKAGVAALASRRTAAEETAARAAHRKAVAREALARACTVAGLDHARVMELHASEAAEVAACRARIRAAETEKANAEGAARERQEEHDTLLEQGLPELPKEELEPRKAALEQEISATGESLGRLSERLDADAAARKALAGLEEEIRVATATRDTWTAVNDAIGSARGDRFAQIAQAVTLALLVERANHHLDDLKPRYQLRVASEDLALHVIDRDMAGDVRPTRLLSGGERFLVSLALALALSGMGTRGTLAGTLFIDEGFGSLDSDSLDLAIDALERLQAQGRMIGVISHVQAMKDRIPVQLQVVKTGGGASEVSVVTSM